MFSVLFLLVELQSTVYSMKFQVIYWELKPYIWTNNGTRDGILPLILERATTLCSTKKYNVTVTYSLNLNTLKAFDRILASKKPRYGKKDLKNITVTETDHVIWFPYPVSLREKGETNPIRLRNLELYDFVYASSISIIMRRDHIKISSKILNGVHTCIPLIIQLFFCSLIAAIIIWFVERNKNSSISQSFIEGTGISLWWSHITITTTGYGDIVPVTIIGRLVASAWMIVGIFIMSIITATITESVVGLSDLNIFEKSIAVLKHSHEERVAIENYKGNQNNVKEYESYQKVIQAVKNKECYAALINSDVASWYENDLRSHKDSPLVVVSNIPLEIPVHLLISRKAKDNESKRFFKCMMKENKDEIITWSIKYFKKPLKTETVYSPKTLSEAVKTTHFVVLGTIPAVLIVVCLLYDFLVRRRNTGAKSQNETNIKENISNDKVYI